MKTITKYMVGFAATALVLTIAVRFSLSTLIEAKLFTIANILGGIYAVSVFIAGWVFGSKECKHLPIYDVGFRYNFVTYLIFSGVSELWFILGLNSAYESIGFIHYAAILWGALVITHYLFYRRFQKQSIDGLNKDDLFE